MKHDLLLEVHRRIRTIELSNYNDGLCRSQIFCLYLETEIIGMLSILFNNFTPKPLLLLILGAGLMHLSWTYRQQESKKKSHSTISYKIIPSIQNTWGYEIYIDSKKVILQRNIPGLPGSLGFKTKASSKKIAEIVVRKLKEGVMPPKVTSEELEKANVL
ncbi:DUF4907 domain-containing protein [Pedobacter sp. KBW01]|uniref:DUF4907 domain-containing protein n=1 Tax=Pedobacter sp. KBW01 TaxID=2153364 RepID=UPI001319E075|nr:DUF4907 domain-containing protein [Pedobacter sp. KBW01]